MAKCNLMENKEELPFGNETCVTNKVQEPDFIWAPASYLDTLGEQELTELTDTL